MPYSHFNDYPADVRERAARVRVACFDVDGTLTDGRLMFDSDGRETKAFHVHDGQGLVLLRKVGIVPVFVTARTSPIAEHRAAELGVVAYTCVADKLACVREIAAGAGFSLDDAGFERALEEQRARARQHGHFLKGEVSPLLQSLGDDHSAFVGYERVEEDSRVVAIIRDGSLVDFAIEGQECEVVLDSTPFYPEGGGQMGDRGNLRARSGVFHVEDTRAAGGAIVHHGRVMEGEIRVAETVEAIVDTAWRSGAAPSPRAAERKASPIPRVDASATTSTRSPALRDALVRRTRRAPSSIAATHAGRVAYSFLHETRARRIRP